MNSNKAYQERPVLTERYETSPLAGKSFNESVIHWYLYIRKWSKLLLIFLLAGISFGVWKVVSFQPVYDTYLLAASRYLSNEQIQGIIESIQAHLDNGDYATVADQLEMTPEQVSQIIYLTCDFTSKNSDKKIFNLQMNIMTNENYGEYESGLFNYLESLDYVKNRINHEKELNKNLLQNIRNAQVKLDEMDLMLSNTLNRQSGFVSSNEDQKSVNDAMIGLANIVDQKMRLNQREYEVERELVNDRNFEVIKGFEKFNRTTRANIFGSFFVPLLVSIVLWGLLTWAMEIKEEIKRRTRLKIK